MSTLAKDPIPAQWQPGPAAAAFAEDVRRGLTRPQKELPSKYLYDAVGSALFEVITLLPEYGLTRADERLMIRYSGELAMRVAPRVKVAELGSGSGRKTRPVLEAITARQGDVTYSAIDVSTSALDQCEKELSGIAGVTVRKLEATYLEGLRQVAFHRPPGERLLVLFVGSSIGNFGHEEAAAFLAGVRSSLRPGDALLLGADLVKPEAQLLAAYDDPIGVTAAFNLNLLSRMNRELGANFDIDAFEHQALWSSQEQRIEMHLRARTREQVRIEAAGLTVDFQAGETIWTESSYKYDAAGLREMAGRAGFVPRAEWVDGEWPFVETLWMAAGEAE